MYYMYPIKNIDDYKRLRTNPKYSLENSISVVGLKNNMNHGLTLIPMIL